MGQALYRFVEDRIGEMRQNSHVLSVPRFGNWQLLHEDSTIVQLWSADREAGRTLTIAGCERTPPLYLRSAISEDKDTMAELDTACVLHSDHILLQLVHMRRIATGKKKKQVSYEEGEIFHILVSRRLSLGGLLAACSASRGSFSRTDNTQATLGEDVDSFTRSDLSG